MTDAPKQANLLVTGIDWLITVDETRRIVRDAAIAIVDGKFAAIGKTAEITKAWNADSTLDASGMVGTPGFVDNHLHSSFQMSRGLADEANAQSFLFTHMYPYEGAMTREDVRVSASLAAMELLRHGVTCFIDPGNYHPAATIEAVSAAGGRMVISRSSFDLTKSVMGVLPETMIETTEKCVDETTALFAAHHGDAGGRLSVSASFRGLNNASDDLILGLKELADKHDALLQTHACFAYSTHDGSLAAYGKPEIERLDDLGVLDERMLLVHSGWLEPHEIEIIRQKKPTLVAAPSSSLHNGYGNFVMGKLPELMALGVNVSIGSDHACSGITDMAQEMFLLAGGYKETRINPRVMPPEHVVEMATINGAKGAGLGDRIGSVEVGKEADLVLFDTSWPDWQPLYNPVSNLVYAANGSSIAHVLVAGEMVVRDGALTRVDEAAVLADVRATAKRIAGRLDMNKVVKLKWPVE
jgi:5-methylthioadenosine/S-adenosylhomocysteine deaminase